MKPTDFFQKWCEVFDENETIKKKLLNWRDYWYNSSAKTSLMESEVYYLIAQKININCSVQYYYIDAVFYQNQDLVPEIPANTTYLKKIRIALEHENNFNRNLYQELSHLLLINCDLRVIVTYPNNYDNSDVIQYFTKIINSDKDLKIENETILLIFGVRGNNNDVYWEGHHNINGQWETIISDQSEDKYLIGFLYENPN